MRTRVLRERNIMSERDAPVITKAEADQAARSMKDSFMFLMDVVEQYQISVDLLSRGGLILWMVTFGTQLIILAKEAFNNGLHDEASQLSDRILRLLKAKLSSEDQASFQMQRFAAFLPFKNTN